MVQCKHTLGDAGLDADVIAEVTRAFEGYRAKRLRAFHGRATLRGVLVTNGKLTAGARRAAAERDVRVYDRDGLAQLLASHECTAADVEAERARRLASMADVQARIAAVRMN